jgi:hypothetical protein
MAHGGIHDEGTEGLKDEESKPSVSTSVPTKWIPSGISESFDTFFGGCTCIVQVDNR